MKKKGLEIDVPATSKTGLCMSTNKCPQQPAHVLTHTGVKNSHLPVVLEKFASFDKEQGEDRFTSN